MRKLLLSLLAVTMLLGFAGLCFAEDESKPAQGVLKLEMSAEMKPVLCVSFAGYDRLVANVDTLGKLGGAANMSQSLDMMIKLMTQGKGLDGLDTKRPWGAVVFGGAEPQFPVLAFIPVTDLKKLVEVAKGMPRLAVATKEDGDVYEIQTGPTSVYMTQKGDWAVLSDRSENLAMAPEDPTKLLGDLPERYGLALRVSLGNISKEFREQVLAQLRAGAEVGMQQMPGESEDDYAVRSLVLKQMIQQWVAVVEDMDDVTLGWNVDPSANSTYLEIDVTFRKGTKLADQMAQVKSGKTNFAGFLMPKAALRGISVATMADADVAQAKTALASVRKTWIQKVDSLGLDDQQAKLAKQLAGDLVDVIEATVEAKKTDVGVAIMLEPGAAVLVSGGTIADGSKLDKTVGQVFEELKKDKGMEGMAKLSDESYEGLHLYVATMPTMNKHQASVVGDTVEIALGIGGDKLMVAAGRDAVKTLKKVLDDSKSAGAKEVPPAKVVLSAAPVAKFIAEVADEPQVKGIAGMMAGLLAKADGKDHVTYSVTPIAHGVRARLEIEKGILKAVGSALPMMMPMGGPMPQAPQEEPAEAE